MKHLLSSALLVALALGALTNAAIAQDDTGAYVIATYHVAPGKHDQFLTWKAKQEAARKEAGIPATQWFVHQHGDDWDYMTLRKLNDPQTEAMQDAKYQEIAKREGLKTGMAAFFEFREFTSRHSDTTALGPFSAQDLLDLADPETRESLNSRIRH